MLGLLLVLLLPVDAARADPRCGDTAFASKCAKQCGALCKTDREFFLDHSDFCFSEPVFSGSAVDTDPSCGDLGSVKPSPLQLCLREAERSARSFEDKLHALESRPDLVATVRESLKGVPTCAPDAPSLLRMFTCLEREGGTITSDFDHLHTRGYTELTSKSKLCEIPREAMSEDFNLAEDLSSRAKQLQMDFSRVNECRNAFEQWGNDVSEQNTTTHFGGLLQDWIDGTRSELEPTEKMAQNLDNQLAAISKQISSITTSISFGLVLCP